MAACSSHPAIRQHTKLHPRASHAAQSLVESVGETADMATIKLVRLPRFNALTASLTSASLLSTRSTVSQEAYRNSSDGAISAPDTESRSSCCGDEVSAVIAPF
eukprot:3994550-Pleurochrysis_carterae.AAC.1